MTPPYSSIAIANTFLSLGDKDGKKLSNMQLQKLVFIAQGYYAAITKGQQLYYHDTYAWQWGPVVPKLYKKLQKFGNGTVSEKIEDETGELAELRPEDNGFAIVRAVWNAYKNRTAAELSALTHKPDTPWSLTWSKKQFDKIPLSFMSDYYSKLLAG